MLMLSIKKNKKTSRFDALVPSLKSENKFDFALNSQINCKGILSPNSIMDQQMPWKVDEEEQILQNQYNPRIGYNFDQELRSIKHLEKVENQRKEYIKSLIKAQKVSDRDTNSSCSPRKKEFKAKMRKFELFGEDDNYHLLSPTKDPHNIANPEFKPFGNYSDSYSSDSGAKSEDDSPLRRRILKSPTKKKPRVLTD